MCVHRHAVIQSKSPIVEQPQMHQRLFAIDTSQSEHLPIDEIGDRNEEYEHNERQSLKEMMQVCLGLGERVSPSNTLFVFF